MNLKWWAAIGVCYMVTLFPDMATARFASRFSLSAAEEYNDNIFFSEQKTHDFVTILTPALHFLYQPQFRTNSLFVLDINAPAEIYARNDEQTNFGDRFSLRAYYIYPYSQQLTFRITDCVARLGETRLGGFDERRGGGFGSGIGNFGVGSGIGNYGIGSGGNFGIGSFGGGGGCGGTASILGGFGRSDPESELDTNDLLATGETLSNDFDISSSFSYSQNLTFNVSYSWQYQAFFDIGGKEDSHEIEVGGRYQLWRLHNLKAIYRLRLLQTRDGKRNVIHDFDVGDDFFSSRQINLTPTLSIWGGTGLTLGSKGGGFDLRHRLNVALVKLWRTAVFSAGVQRGLTGSFGVSGPSYTTDFFSQYGIQITRRLTAFAAASYSLYDTEDSDFTTFYALGGFQYWLTNWMSANLVYSYRRLNPDGNNRDSEIIQNSTIDGNSVVLSVSMYFDIWPNVGLARSVAANSQIFGLPQFGSGITQPEPVPQPAEQTPAPNP